MGDKAEHFKRAFVKTRTVFNEWDPYDLIKSGAPEDEYDDYVHNVLSGLINNSNDLEIAEQLNRKLSEAFEKYFTVEECLNIIKKMKRVL